MRILGLNSKQQEWRVTFDQIKSINDDRIEIIEEGKKGFNDTAYCSTSEWDNLMRLESWPLYFTNS